MIGDPNVRYTSIYTWACPSAHHVPLSFSMSAFDERDRFASQRCASKKKNALMGVAWQFAPQCCFPYFPSHPLSLSFPLIRFQLTAALPSLLVLRVFRGFRVAIAWAKQKRVTCGSARVIDHWMCHMGHLKICNWKDCTGCCFSNELVVCWD